MTLSIFNLIMCDFLWGAGPEWYCLSWVMAGLLFSLGWFIEFPPPPPVRYIFRSMGEGGGIFPLIPEPFWQLGNPIDTFWSSTQLENQESLEIRFFLLPNMNAITTLSTLFTNLVRFPSFLYLFIRLSREKMRILVFWLNTRRPCGKTTISATLSYRKYS